MPLRLLVQHLAHVILPTAQGLAELGWEWAELGVGIPMTFVIRVEGA